MTHFVHDFTTGSTGPYTFDRGSEATYTDSDGLVKTAAVDIECYHHDGNGDNIGLQFEGASTNNLANSSDLSTWTATNVTVGTHGTITAPDGTLTAYHVQDTGTNSGVLQTTGSSVGEGCTIWARAVSGTGTVHLMNSNGDAGSIFTLTTEWQRFYVTKVTDGNFVAVDFRDAGTTLTEALVWGPQSETIWGPVSALGKYYSSYIPTTGTPVSRSETGLYAEDVDIGVPEAEMLNDHCGQVAGILPGGWPAQDTCRIFRYRGSSSSAQLQTTWNDTSLTYNKEPGGNTTVFDVDVLADDLLDFRYRVSSSAGVKAWEMTSSAFRDDGTLTEDHPVGIKRYWPCASSSSSQEMFIHLQTIRVISTDLVDSEILDGTWGENPVAPAYGPQNHDKDEDIGSLDFADGWQYPNPTGFSLLNAPDGIGMSTTGIVTGAGTAAGTWNNVIVRNTSRSTNYDAVPFTWTIASIDTPTPPESYPPQNHYKDVDIGSVDLSSGWTNANPTGFSMLNGPDGLTMSTGGIVTGVPLTAATYNNVIVRNTDGGTDYDADPFTWTIAVEPAEPPTYQSRTNTEGDSVNWDASVNWNKHDPNGFSATGLPTGLNISIAGLVTGNPTVPGDFTVAIINTKDGEAFPAADFNWHIDAAPIIPVPPSYGPQDHYKDEDVGNLDLSVDWTDADPAGFEMFNHPPGLSMDTAGVVTGAASSVGTYSNVIVRNTRDAQQVDADPFTWTITVEPAEPPPYDGRNNQVDDAVNWDASVGWDKHDPNGFSATGLPPALGISAQGVVSGTVTTAETYSVSIINTKEGEQFSGQFTWIVTENIVPIPPDYQDRQSTKGIYIGGINFAPPWVDADPNGFSMLNGPDGLTMDATGLVTGTPNTVAIYSNVIVRNTSDGNDYDADPFTWTIVIDPPIPPTYDDRHNDEGDGVNWNAADGWDKADPNGFSATGLPPTLGMSLQGVVTGTTTTAGTYAVTVTNRKDGQDFTAGLDWYVYTVPVPPSYGPQSHYKDIDVGAIDLSTNWVGANPTGFSMHNGPNGLTMDSAGVVRGTPLVAGTFNNVIVRNFSNGNNYDAQPFTWDITIEPAEPPPYGPLTDNKGDDVSENLAAGWSKHDPAGFRMTGHPPGLSMDSAGQVTGKPTTGGIYSTTVINAKEGEDFPASAFDWTITENPQPPTYNRREIWQGSSVNWDASANWVDADPDGFSWTGHPPEFTMSAQGVVTGTATTIMTYSNVVITNTKLGVDYHAAAFEWAIIAAPDPSELNGAPLALQLRLRI